MSFDRFDIAEAYYLLRHDHNSPRDDRHCRPNRWGESLTRLRFRPSPALNGYSDLTANGQAIYEAIAERIERDLAISR